MALFFYGLSTSFSIRSSLSLHQSFKINYMDTNEIIRLFTNGPIDFEDIESKKLECTYGIQLVQKSTSRSDTRHNQSDKDWIVNQVLGWGGSLKDEYPYRWDITSDASVVCHRSNFVEFLFFDLIVLSKEEQDTIFKEKEKAELEALERARIVDILTPVLIHQMMPFSKVHTGFLEINYGIHLKQIKRGMHMNMRYKPRNGSENWVANQVLCWGSNTGWDITTDGKIACCRINYDDYVNFEIEVLTNEQIEEYKKKNIVDPTDALKKLQVLKKMFDEGLITINEYDLKKEELLKLYH